MQDDCAFSLALINLSISKSFYPLRGCMKKLVNKKAGLVLLRISLVNYRMIRINCVFKDLAKTLQLQILRSPICLCLLPLLSNTIFLIENTDVLYGACSNFKSS